MVDLGSRYEENRGGGPWGSGQGVLLELSLRGKEILEVYDGGIADPLHPFCCMELCALCSINSEQSMKVLKRGDGAAEPLCCGRGSVISLSHTEIPLP